jgi:hypothetical protein
VEAPAEAQDQHQQQGYQHHNSTDHTPNHTPHIFPVRVDDWLWPARLRGAGGCGRPGWSAAGRQWLCGPSGCHGGGR